MRLTIIINPREGQSQQFYGDYKLIGLLLLSDTLKTLLGRQMCISRGGQWSWAHLNLESLSTT